MEVLPPLPVGHALEGMTASQAQMKTLALGNSLAPARRFAPERDGFWDDYRYEIDPSFPALAEEVALHRHNLTQTA
jgi:1-acyl-sn-glycerol-3-phosphate acyltransferase